MCRRNLVQDPEHDDDREAVIGEECHIEARAARGPRSPGEGAGSNQYANLILLCRTCHKRVDDQPAYFTPIRLRGIKADHEQAVSAALNHGTTRLVSNLPPRGRFSGREAILQELANVLARNEAAVLRQPLAIHGLGGVGKTRVALEYAYRHRDEYSMCWWIRAEDSASRISDYAALAGPLGLPKGAHPLPSQIVATVRRTLEEREGWLLIFDNAGGPADLQDFIPSSHAGDVIITSRKHGGWRGIATPVALDVWDRPESVAFLYDQTGRHDEGADALADALGDLPLALAQAAAYIDATAITASGYLARLQSVAPELLSVAGPIDYERTVWSTWQLAFAEVAQHPLARAFLALCGHVAPDRIPRALLVARAACAGETNELTIDEAIERLLQYSLLTASAADSFSMHRLVQLVTRNQCGSRDALAVRSVESVFPVAARDVASWPACERLLPHALAATGHANAIDVEPLAAAQLLHRVGIFQMGQGEYLAARNSLEQALAIKEHLFDPDDAEIGFTLTSLGNLFSTIGDHSVALACRVRAYEILAGAYGPRHPEVAMAINNLGNSMQDLDDPTRARDLHEQALTIFEDVLPPTSPEIAGALMNGGIDMLALDNLPAARERLERAVELFEGHGAQAGFELSRALTNLGIVLQKLGETELARNQLERAVMLKNQSFGPEHPEVAVTLVNLANVLHEQRDFNAARDAVMRALAIEERAYGPHHEEVAITLTALAVVLRELGDLGAARRCEDRIRRIRAS